MRSRMIHVPATGVSRPPDDLLVAQDGMRDPLLLQRLDGVEQSHQPVPVLGQRIVHEEEAVILDLFEFLDDAVDGAGPELLAAEKGTAAGKAVEPTAARGVHEVHHLDAAIVVQRPAQKVPAGRPDPLHRRRIPHEIVHRL
jgi:hypothetical protein